LLQVGDTMFPSSRGLEQNETDRF